MKWLCPGCSPKPGATGEVCPLCCGYRDPVTEPAGVLAYREGMRAAYRIRRMRRIDQAHRQARKAASR